MATGDGHAPPLSLHVQVDRIAAWLAEHRLYCVTALVQQLCTPQTTHRPTTAATSLLTTAIKPTRGPPSAAHQGLPSMHAVVEVGVAALQLLAGRCPHETPLLEGAAVDLRCVCEAGDDEALSVNARVGGLVNVFHAAHAAWEPVVEPWVLQVLAAAAPPSAGWGGGLGGAGCAVALTVPGKVDITLTEVCGFGVVW